MMAAPIAHGTSLAELLAGCEVTGDSSGRWRTLWLSGISDDSRTVRPGAAFFAVRGERQHGVAYAKAACAAGAVAIIIDQHASPPAVAVPVLTIPDLREQLSAIAARWHGDPSAALEVVAVTGTNGKTTVCHLLADLFGDRAGYIGTLGAGTIGALQTTGLTTPGAFAMQDLLASFRDRGVTRVAVEASSHALDQSRLQAVKTRCAVFTNLTRDHLDYHGAMDAYLAAKARVFALVGVRHGVFNLDDPAVATLYRAYLDRLECWSFAVTREALPSDASARSRHVQIGILGEHEDGMDLAIHAAGLRARVRVPFVGAHNAANLGAVVAVALALGDAPSDSIERLAALHQVPGRLQRIGATRPAIYVDYAHTPDALQQSLATLRPICRDRLWCVFGCGGDRDTGKRPLMGAVAARLADQVVITSDNPRHEAPEAIAADIARGIPPESNPIFTLDRREAIANALDLAREDDVILVAGKGHETSQQFADRVIEFSDAAVIHELLAERAP